jgi:hypothetical protein
VACRVGRQARAQPRQHRQRLAGAHRIGLGVQAAEGPVDEQHAALDVEHRHTFGHHVEGMLHAVGDHRGRVQVLQGAPHVQAISQPASQRHEGHQAHRGLGQPALEPAACIGLEGHLDGAPALPTRAECHAHLVGLLQLVRVVAPGLCVLARFDHQLTVAAAQAERANALDTPRHRAQRGLDGGAFVAAQQLGHLHCHRLRDALSLALLHVGLRRHGTDEQVGHRHQGQRQHHQREGQLHERAGAFHRACSVGSCEWPWAANRLPSACSGGRPSPSSGASPWSSSSSA